MTIKTTGAGDDARPDDAACRVYLRAYLRDDEMEALFDLWQLRMNHARAVEADQRGYLEAYGLSGLQVGEGARRIARRIAQHLAGLPALSPEQVIWKIALKEDLERDPDETRRSLTLVMLRSAIAADFARLGMVFDVDAKPPSGGGRH